MKTLRSAPVRRSLDRSPRGKPLRLTIGRAVGRNRAGNEQFVTQVRFGEDAAVLVPWDLGRRDVPPAGLGE
jgi:hypothetical protein